VALNIEQSGWKAVLGDLRHARTILLLGGTDTGKTTFLTWLANNLLGREQRIAIVDADVGQSSLGPPTTIGLSLVAEPFERLQELPPVGLYFVGATSPRGHLLPVIVGTKRLVDRARRLGAGQVIVDTCGFIGADGGQALKHYQIDLVDPDVVVCLQRGEECEPILLALGHRQRPHVLRLRASHACRRRGIEERRRHRQRALQTYLGRTKIISPLWVDLDLVEAPVGCGTALDVESHELLRHVRTPAVVWAEQRDGELYVILRSYPYPDAVAELARATGLHLRTWLVGELHGTLLGLLNEAGDTVGIGILQRIDFSSRRFEVLTAEGIEGIRGVHWSQTRLGPSGDLEYMRSRAT
jgi:polynucleotide 5'-hydroxyl-kinase GRC3/NOL9